MEKTETQKNEIRNETTLEVHLKESDVPIILENWDIHKHVIFGNKIGEIDTMVIPMESIVYAVRKMK